jgi:hypothetical protein
MTATALTVLATAGTSGATAAGSTPLAQARASLRAGDMVRLAHSPTSGKAKVVPVTADARAALNAAGVYYHLVCYQVRGWNYGYDAFGNQLFSLSVAMHWCVGTNILYGPFSWTNYYIYSNWNGTNVTQNSTHSTDAPWYEGWNYQGWDTVGNIDPQWVTPYGNNHEQIYLERTAHWSHCSLGVPVLCNQTYPFIQMWVYYDGSWGATYGAGH